MGLTYYPIWGNIISYPQIGYLQKGVCPSPPKITGQKATAMTILEQLWQGTLRPAEMKKPQHPQYTQLLNTADETEKQLLSLLTDEGKKLFYKLKGINTELYAIDESDIFINAFRLGANLILETKDGASAPSKTD